MADINHLLALISRAVYNNIEPGVTGAVVSGGIDSSTVVALAHQYEPIPTFTGYYEHDGCDERHYANLVAKSNHTEILITPQDFIDNFDEMLKHIRPPYQGMGTFGQYMVGKHIADNTDLKVILSGEGSDELFGGYARLLIVAGEDPPVGYEMYKVPDDYPRNVAAALALDFYRLNDLLAVDDQCMAAHGLEARAPFTDREVVEYVLCQPAHERVGKRMLKDTVRGIVPDKILDRTDKCGFPIPLNAWAQGPLKDFIGDRIGYIPDPSTPWDRRFWYDLIAAGSYAKAA